MFLSTSSASRVNFTEDKRLTADDIQTVEKAFHDSGIYIVVHGHNDEQGAVLGTPQLPIVSIDRTAFKFGDPWGRNMTISTLTIDCTGGAVSAEANQVIRQT